MANFEIDFPDDFLSELLETDFDEICEEGLKQAAPIIENSMKRSLKSVISHEGDSELVESIEASKPKKTKTDAWIINVNPTGKSDNYYYPVIRKRKSRSHGWRVYWVSNALKAIWLEYGVEGRQAPKPWLQKAVNDIREDVISMVQNIYNKKTGAT